MPRTASSVLDSIERTIRGNNPDFRHTSHRRPWIWHVHPRESKSNQGKPCLFTGTWMEHLAEHTTHQNKEVVVLSFGYGLATRVNFHTIVHQLIEGDSLTPQPAPAARGNIRKSTIQATTQLGV